MANRAAKRNEDCIALASGLGRSAVVAALYWIARGLTAETAVEKVLQKMQRAGWVTDEEQRQWVTRERKDLLQEYEQFTSLRLCIEGWAGRNRSRCNYEGQPQERNAKRSDHRRAFPDGLSTGLHYHVKADEFFYVISGRGTARFGGGRSFY